MKPTPFTSPPGGPLSDARAVLAALAVLAFAVVALPPASAMAASAEPATSPSPQPPLSPSSRPRLSPSDYRARAVCRTPAPGYSGCLSLRLVADEPAAVPGAETAPQVTEFTEPIPGSLTPANLTSAYGVSGAAPPGTQTIALVDAYDDATIAGDLEVFSQRFGLPACNEANGCLRKVNQSGNPTPLPASSGEKERGWAQEIATDVEIAHGVCPSCRLLLVEANSNSNSTLYRAEQTAVELGATEISNSWGGEEPGGERAASVDSAYFDHPGIVVTASSGDSGYLDWFSEEPSQFANYPASSPHVIGVGGTRLTLSSTGAWESETVWNDGGASGGFLEGAGASGGGCSGHFAADAWQQAVPDWPAVGCGSARAVADISADGDPYSGVAVYDSTETPQGEKGWSAIGGTSVASPIIASLFALAGGAQGVAYPAQLLYENLQQNPLSLHDVTVGSNGECLRRFHKSSGASGCTSEEQARSCAAQLICLAGSGYDGPSGVGTPNGLAAFRPPLAGGGGTSAVSTTGQAPPVAGVEPPVSGTSSPGTASGAGAGKGALARTPVVSGLSITRRALAALRRHPRLSQLGFAFTLNAPARVHVTLSRRVRVNGRMRWRAVSAPLAYTAPSGRQSRRLSGRAALPHGRYLLTVSPEHGVARSIVLRIG
jgi:subtilase family protein